MKNTHPICSENTFLVFYTIYSVLVLILITTLGEYVPYKLQDEMTVVLIPPGVYAAIYYPRYMYVLCLLIGTAFACVTIILANSNIPKSLIVVAFVFVTEIIIFELVFRTMRFQRELIRTNERIKNKLELTISQFGQLSESLPVCQMCNKLRTDEKVWSEFETLLHDKLEIDLVKGICQDCTKELVDDLSADDEIERETPSVTA